MQLITRQHFLSPEELLDGSGTGVGGKLNPQAFRYFQTPDADRNKSKRILGDKTEHMIMNAMKGEWSREAKSRGVDVVDVL